MQTEDYRLNALILALLSLSGGLCMKLILDFRRHGWAMPIVPRRPVPWQVAEVVAIAVFNLLCIGALMQEVFRPPVSSTETSPIGQLLKTNELDAGLGGDDSAEDLAIRGRKQLSVLQMNVAMGAAVLVMLPLTLCLWCRCRLADFGLHREGMVEDLRFALWGVLVVLLPISLISLPLVSIRTERPHEMFVLLQESAGNQLMLFWIGLSVIVMAPLLEELLFRVLLQGALERDLSPLLSIVVTSLAFVGIHKPADWLPLLPMALMLSYCYYRRRSYLTVVALHAMFNALNLLYAVLSQ